MEGASCFVTDLDAAGRDVMASPNGFGHQVAGIADRLKPHMFQIRKIGAFEIMDAACVN